MKGVCASVPALVALALAIPAASAIAQSGTALSFDGNDDCVFVPYDASFPIEVFTASAWIKTPRPMQGNAAVIGRGEDDDSFNFAWQVYLNRDGNLQVTLEDTRERNFCYPLSCMGGKQESCTVTGELFVADDEWHHVAATRTAAGVIALYVDGVSVVTCTNTGVPSVNNQQFLTIGCTHFFIGPPPEGEEPTDWFFPGVIDEPAMWSIALAPADVADVVANGVDPESPGLTGFWDFDEGEGQAVHDASPAGNDGFRGEEEGFDPADPEWLVLDVPCPADLDGSGAVDFGDILAVLAAWGQKGGPEDLDESGTVDFGDLLIVLAAWGPCA